MSTGVEPMSDTCTKCGREITETTITFEAKSYHPLCFVCHRCGKDLCGLSIYKVDDQLTDPECYSKFFAPKCAVCEEPLVNPTKEKYASFGEYTYHAQCFRCNECDETLLGMKFYILEDGNVCSSCYEGSKKDSGTGEK